MSRWRVLGGARRSSERGHHDPADATSGLHGGGHPLATRTHRALPAALADAVAAEHRAEAGQDTEDGSGNDARYFIPHVDPSLFVYSVDSLSSVWALKRSVRAERKRDGSPEMLGSGGGERGA